ncbi:hypothetical protein A1O7_06013 [Cladophialophora yegresii CBS 114405]|uniref:BHLH domain-containing protein n=1 Tax=Cladophialophora yegresii CBS 114405 TaxID=1182544 RepID=W9W247_9EURO|nr:uncharacterized protein A1O7_06013 [Cladophialophora yegresii CBS 114405]EXJ58586.1 hypothetical protein A1O7_06013 [Cladophialophora yegresii CBS 114405]
MPKPRPPPTPTGSTDLAAAEAKGHHAADMESMFALPPPAMRSDAHAQARPSKSSQARKYSGTAPTQATPPISPQDKPLTGSPRHKRTASGAVKAAVEAKWASADGADSYALPPPPSRARKIIQMKPKGPQTSTSSPSSDADYLPPGSSSAASAVHSAPSTKESATGRAATAASAGASTISKRKQPSATSAAGRKIARKTAHSIIERRRRSKMNEEFGVLKDMIPACEGVEMHKLAILQAGIEYVRYLEGCVAQLKAENARSGSNEMRPSAAARSRMEVDDASVEDEDFDDNDDEEDEDEQLERQNEPEVDELVDHMPDPAPPAKLRSNRHSTTATTEWSLRDSRRPSIASLTGSSAYPSPHILSQSQSLGSQPHQGVGMLSTTPTPTLLSPAFNSIHFSPDLSRTQTNSSVARSSTSLASTAASWTTVNNPPSGSISNPSPSMQPLPSPKAMMGIPLPQPAMTRLKLPGQYNAAVQWERDAGSRSPGAASNGSGTAEATASAALMMLTNEWRGGGRQGGPEAGVGAGAPIASEGAAGQGDVKDRGKGMSVRDLLSS